jgi:hypothetical protein
VPLDRPGRNSSAQSSWSVRPCLASRAICTSWAVSSSRVSGLLGGTDSPQASSSGGRARRTLPPPFHGERRRNGGGARGRRGAGSPGAATRRTRGGPGRGRAPHGCGQPVRWTPDRGGTSLASRGHVLGHGAHQIARLLLPAPQPTDPGALELVERSDPGRREGWTHNPERRPPAWLARRRLHVPLAGMRRASVRSLIQGTRLRPPRRRGFHPRLPRYRRKPVGTDLPHQRFRAGQRG